MKDERKLGDASDNDHLDVAFQIKKIPTVKTARTESGRKKRKKKADRSPNDGTFCTISSYRGTRLQTTTRHGIKRKAHNQRRGWVTTEPPCVFGLAS